MLHSLYKIPLWIYFNNSIHDIMDKVFSHFQLLFLILIFLLFSCSKSLDDGPKILWESQSTTTYSYSGGVISGVNIYVNFSTMAEGDVFIETKLDNKKLSKEIHVVLGELYTVKTICDISSSGGSQLIISSPSADDNFVFNFSDSKMELTGLSLY